MYDGRFFLLLDLAEEMLETMEMKMPVNLESWKFLEALGSGIGADSGQPDSCT
jgi:hypothetical protein